MEGLQLVQPFSFAHENLNVFLRFFHFKMHHFVGEKKWTVVLPRFSPQIYTTQSDMRLTIHFLIMERDPEAGGSFTLKDGGRDGKPLQTVKIDNGTFPESITTETNKLYVNLQVRQICLIPLSLCTTAGETDLLDTLVSVYICRWDRSAWYPCLCVQL